ncbi:MAG TPA: nucleoside hydrolase [Candidatus Baltobacteraceae bacterium]|nr:nucleoside hydrolase [Candidatus Baltobacteraceae bacterium]
MLDIIISTDPGHDDAMAIMLAVRSGMFRIRAITTVAGNSTVANTTRNARYVLDLLRAQDIPVYSGSSRPLKRPLVQAVVHGKSGLEGIDPKNAPMLTGNAVEKTIEIVRRNPGKITLVTLGPLTDVAKAMLKSPRAMSRLKEIVMMGGAIRVPGNKNRVAEFNIFVDPEAADVVFRFPVKKTLVPLDTCNQVSLQLSDFRKIADPELREPLMRMARPYITNLAKNEGANGALMYDPLTIYYLMNPRACRSQAYDIAVETKGELTRGMTVAELRKPVKPKANVTVVEKISESGFRRDFIKALSARS